MHFSVAAFTLGFAALATAQSSSTFVQTSGTIASVTASVITNTNTVPTAAATSYPIDIGAINATTRVQWCQAQQNSCFQICDSDPSTNTCASDTLVWACKCSSGTTPNLATFNQTVPYFECITYKAQCVAQTDSAETQRQCLAVPCGGSVLPANYVSTASSMMASTMMTGSMTGSMASASTATATAAAGGNGAGQMALNVGLGAVAGGAALMALAL